MSYISKYASEPFMREYCKQPFRIGRAFCWQSSILEDCNGIMIGHFHCGGALKTGVQPIEAIFRSIGVLL